MGPLLGHGHLTTPQKMWVHPTWSRKRILRETIVGIVVAMDGQGDLLEVVLALDPRGGGANLLDGWQQKTIRIAMMAITTSNSISVNARRR